MSKLLRILSLIFLLGIPAFGQIWKPQSVASTVEILLRDTTTQNGKTGITVTGITCDWTKPSNTLSATKTTFTGTASGGSTHDILEVGHGKYNVEMPAADLDTIGTNYLECQCTNAFDTKVTVNVVSAASWDVNFNGNISDNATVASAIWAALTAANAVSGSFGEKVGTNLDEAISTVRYLNDTDAAKLGIPTGTATAGGNNTITLAASESAINTAYYRALIVLTGGTGAGQRATVSGYVGSTKVATVFCSANPTTGNWTTNPDATTTYAIFPVIPR